MIDPVSVAKEMFHTAGISGATVAKCLDKCLGIKVSRMKVTRWFKDDVEPSWTEGEALISLCSMVEYLQLSDKMPPKSKKFGDSLVETILKETSLELEEEVTPE